MLDESMRLRININDIFKGRLVKLERLEFKEDFNPQPNFYTLRALDNGFIIRELDISSSGSRPNRDTRS
jgi:hypothetical protein